MVTNFQSLSGNIPVQSSAPTNPAEGEMYYDTTLNYLRRYDGSNWKNASFNTTTSTSTTSSTSTSTTISTSTSTTTT